MSQNYYAYTLALPQAEVPSRFVSEKDILHVFDNYWNKIDPDFSEAIVPNDRSASQYVLEGSTRNGWAYWAIEKMVEVRSLRGLSFLTGAEYDQFVATSGTKDYGSGWKVSTLDTQRIEVAISSIESLLRWAKEDPDAIERLLCFEGGTLVRYIQPHQCIGTPELAKENSRLLEAVNATTVSMSSRAAPYSEDGDGYDYLFMHLRSLLYMLRVAKRKAYYVANFYLWPGS